MPKERVFFSELTEWDDQFCKLYAIISFNVHDDHIYEISLIDKFVHCFSEIRPQRVLNLTPSTERLLKESVLLSETTKWGDCWPKVA